MESTPEDGDRVAVVREQLHQALRDGRTDAAGPLIDELAEIDPASAADPLPRVYWLLQRDRTQDALHLINEHGSEAFPELRAVCLQRLDDPTWRGLATSLHETGDDRVREAMGHLLGLPPA